MKHTSTPARDVFLHLLLIVTLIISVVSFLSIVFSLVGIQFPEPWQGYGNIDGMEDGIRAGMAALLIGLPIHIWIAWIIEKDLRKDAKKLQLSIRKWLLYLALFITSITLIIDAIIIVHSFLGGDLTIAFSIKALAVLLVAGTIFGYYKWDLKRESAKESRIPLYAAITSGVLGILLITTALFMIDSPGVQRAQDNDQAIISDLQEVQWAIIDYYQREDVLPADLTSLQNQVKVEITTPYTYQVTSETTFSLCAIFETNQQIVQRGDYYELDVYGLKGGGSWLHAAGEHCFEREVSIEDLDHTPDVLKLR